MSSKIVIGGDKNTEWCLIKRLKVNSYMQFVQRSRHCMYCRTQDICKNTRNQTILQYCHTKAKYLNLLECGTEKNAFKFIYIFFIYRLFDVTSHYFLQKHGNLLHILIHMIKEGMNVPKL